jgi:acyl-CoA thioester hydrolase
VPGVHARCFDVDATSIDALGHVNNLEYLRWMQEIATAHSAAVGWPMERYAATGTGWVVRTHTIEYLRPAFAGERIAALTWVRAMGGQSSPRRYLFVRARDRAVLAKAETLWVFVRAASGRPARVPAELGEAFPLLPDEAPIVAALAAWSPP